MIPIIIGIVALVAFTRVLLARPRWTAEGRRIRIPARQRFVLWFMCFWLTGWTFAGIETIRQVTEKPQPFLFLWLGFWAFGMVAAVWTILWQLLGSEVVELEGGVLRLRSEVGGLGSTREFEITSVRDLRAVPLGEDSSERITFNYGARTFRFGSSLDEAEAKQLVDYLAGLAPSLRDSL